MEQPPNSDLYTLEAYLVNKAHRELTDGIERDPITRLRLLCFSRGATGILSLARAFRAMDDDGSKALNEEEFISGIHGIGLNVTDAEIKELFKRFDEDGRGSIDMTEFLVKLRPPMSQYRLEIIDQAFAKMDKDNDGIISINDVKKVYSVEEHPKYETGEMSKDEILSQFLHNFEGGRGNLDGKITHEEFVNYYCSISASIDKDSYFDLLMRCAYDL